MTNEPYARHQLLLQDRLSATDMEKLLAPAHFADASAAARRLQGITGDAPTSASLAACLAPLLPALSGAASPDAALVSFERYVRSAASARDLFDYLAANPRAIEMLVTLFSGSQFLTEILLRNPHYFQRFMERRELALPKSVEQFYAEAQMALAPFTELNDQLNALRRFQRWELLRIGASDFFGLLDLTTVTSQLSRLAESLIRLCLTLAVWRSGQTAAGFAVVALGKLGGGELNYSSDIDLLFLARRDPAGYQTLAQMLIDALVRMTPHGFLYRVDMRLRPWGGSGPLVSGLDAYMTYMQQHARLWEKQALLKARVVAGEETLGREFLQQIEPMVFVEPPDVVRANVHRMKQRTESYLRQRGRTWGEIKLGEGSIRDVEFVAQYLQLAHGGDHPEIRSGATLEALSHLFNGDFITVRDYRVLADGYIFMRAVEHYLQLMHYRQTSTLPGKPEDLDHFARRLGFGGSNAGQRFLARYEQQRATIRAVYTHYLGTEHGAAGVRTDGAVADAPPGQLHSHLARMHASYAATFSEPEIRRHAAMAVRLSPTNLVEVEAEPLGDGRWRATIVAFDYFGELSLICGLLSVYDFNILDGDVFTYEPQATDASAASPRSRRSTNTRRPRPPHVEPQKIVDVFTLRPMGAALPPDVWTRYAADLSGLLQRLDAGAQQEAQGLLVKRFAVHLRRAGDEPPTLYPVEVDIDNDASQHYTVLRINAPDTAGFLYEFTNALALNGVYIARVTVDTIGERVRDILYVTDAQAKKITSAAKVRELRAASALVKHFTHLLPRSPDPESALLHFRAFLGHLFRRPGWPDELVSLEHPDVLNALARLLGVSDFLWNDFLRMQYANLFPVVRDVSALDAPVTAAALQAELDEALTMAPTTGARRTVLNAFKDRAMFRIDMRYILGHIREFGQFSGELSDLADIVVRAAFRLCWDELIEQFGTPLLEARGDDTTCPVTICGLGKCGGRELGFASDIELMFVYGGAGATSGPQPVSNAEFFERLVQIFITTIHARREGIFEIDLRLRPYGKAGSLAVSRTAFERYFAPGGPAWAYERQALIRLRPLAGDEAFGRQIMALRDTMVYTGESFDVSGMRAMRERQLRHLVTAGTLNAKFSPGASVDLEYLVQGLQITHGRDIAALRRENTAEAMAALAEAGLLGPDDYQRLRTAHIFIRRLINALRMVRGNTRDLTVPPAGSEEFTFLTQRLGYGDDEAGLHDDLTLHTTFIRQLNTRLLA